jgi:hypothetical protein
MAMRGESGNNLRIVNLLKHPQTGTGTVQIAAINTAAITAVIFNLMDRSIASSEAMPTSTSPIRGLSCLRCDADHVPTGCFAGSPRPLVGFGPKAPPPDQRSTGRCWPVATLVEPLARLDAVRAWL